ncbi:MAG TPA: PTS transporter subunit EIIC [Candidatus Eisenbacteria bacterium]|nr:PTS transporter subunit EIIC [Candidatus Eisenbacteria bacterium]
MNRATTILNQRIVPALAAVSENTYLSAIRAGMVSVVPLTIIGGLFTIIANPPIPSLDKVVAPHRDLLLLPVTATFGLLAVFVCFTIGYDLGKRLKQEAIVSATISTLIFLMLQLQANNQGISIEGLGSKGLFTAVLIALISVRVQKFFTDKGMVIKLPPNVPSMVYESFLSLSPLVFLVLVFWLIRFVFGVDIDHLVQTAFKPLVVGLNTLPGILLYAFLVTLLWSVGINGDNTMDAIVAPIFLQYLTANVEALTHGSPLPYVTANGFFSTFVNVGGTGATIALALVLLNSKEPGFRSVSRLSLPTQIFQINEPIFFGLPIVLNPIFMIPYILNALILTTLTYLLMQWNLIHRPVVNVPWTTPPVIGHFLVTGGDWRAALWGLISILIAMAVYFPFAKAAERQRLQMEVKAARSQTQGLQTAPATHSLQSETPD